MNIIETEFKGHKFQFMGTPSARELVAEIFADNYKVVANNLPLAPGDVILDIGACEGIFSILMSKLYPEARIIALEPVPRTFYQMMRNIGLNGAGNIEARCVGVGGARGDRTLVVSKDHSGGSSAVCTYVPSDHLTVPVKMITLADVFAEFRIGRVALLKIDIEGMEYEALYGAEDELKKVDYFTGEFHMNHKLDFDGRRMDGLMNWVANRTKLLAIQPCRMAE